MPTPTLVDASNFIKGVSAAEAGINIESYSQRWEDPMEYIEDKAGSNTGFFHNFNPSTTCTISGETNVASLEDTLGVAFGVAETVANAISGYGVTTGDFYLTDIEISQDRGSLASATANLVKHPEITDA